MSTQKTLVVCADRLFTWVYSPSEDAKSNKGTKNETLRSVERSTGRGSSRLCVFVCVCVFVCGVVLPTRFNKPDSNDLYLQETFTKLKITI